MTAHDWKVIRGEKTFTGRPLYRCAVCGAESTHSTSTYQQPGGRLVYLDDVVMPVPCPTTCEDTVALLVHSS